MAHKASGSFLLRIEDIDQSRAREEWEELIYADLQWLGLSWEVPIMRQSTRIETYQSTLKTLWDRDLLYPCTCNRRDIENALSAPQEGAEMPMGPDGVIYPGTCRREVHGDIPDGVALRLNMRRAMAELGKETFEFSETGDGSSKNICVTAEQAISDIGDIVLARRDMGTSYHLSVVLDDAAQGISHVVRGRDLFDATKIHVILQHLLDLPTPVYHHHRLIRDDAGKRLAKRDDARAIRKYREDGATPKDVREMVGL